MGVCEHPNPKKKPPLLPSSYLCFIFYVLVLTVGVKDRILLPVIFLKVIYLSLPGRVFVFWDCPKDHILLPLIFERLFICHCLVEYLFFEIVWKIILCSVSFLKVHLFFTVWLSICFLRDSEGSFLFNYWAFWSSGDGILFQHLQVMRIADKGADLVRITVQGKKEADACFDIKNSLVQKK